MALAEDVGVIARIALQVVIARTTVEGVVARTTGQVVVASTSGQGFGSTCTVLRYARRRRGRRQPGLHSRVVPGGSIGELEVLHRVGRGAILVEVALHTDLVIGARNADDQIIAASREHHIRREHARVQLDHIGIGAQCIRIVVVDRVLATASTEAVDIGAIAPLQVVVAGATVERVVAGIAVQVVVVLVALKAVRIVATVQRVTAQPSLEQVSTITAAQVVLTCSSVQRVVAGQAIQGVVAITAGQAIGRGVAAQAVIAHGAGLHLGLDRGDVPGRAISELEGLQRVGGCAIQIEVALHHHLVRRAVDPDDQIVAAACQHHVRGEDARAQFDDIGVGAKRVRIVVVDGVLATASAEAVDICTIATLQVVVAGTAVECVVAGIAVEIVVVLVALQAVRIVATVQGIVAHPTLEHIGTVTAAQVVLTCTSVQRVVAGQAVQGVAAITTGQAVGRSIAGQTVIAGGAGLHLGLDRGDVPGRSIDELDGFQCVGRRPVLVEIALHHHLVRRAIDADDQVIAAARQHHVGREHARPQLDHIGIGAQRIRVVVVDRVLATAPAEAVDIRAIATLQVVVAGTAVESVVAGISVEMVVVLVALQAVGIVATVQGVVAQPALEHIGTIAAAQVILANTAIQRVIATFTAQGVMAIAAGQAIRRGIAGEAVVARRADLHLGLDRGDVPGRSIDELDSFDRVGRSGILVEVARDTQLVIGALDADDQVTATARQHHVRHGDASPQLDRVGVDAQGIGIVVADRILTIATAEQVDVGPVTAGQPIVARATIERVIAGIAVEVVVAA